MMFKIQILDRKAIARGEINLMGLQLEIRKINIQKEIGKMTNCMDMELKINRLNLMKENLNKVKCMDMEYNKIK